MIDCDSLFLSWKVEDQNGEVEDANTGDDEVHNVEEWLPPDLQVEEDV